MLFPPIMFSLAEVRGFKITLVWIDWKKNKTSFRKFYRPLHCCLGYLLQKWMCTWFRHFKSHVFGMWQTNCTWVHLCVHMHISPPHLHNTHTDDLLFFRRAASTYYRGTEISHCIGIALLLLESIWTNLFDAHFVGIMGLTTPFGVIECASLVWSVNNVTHLKSKVKKQPEGNIKKIWAHSSPPPWQLSPLCILSVLGWMQPLPPVSVFQSHTGSMQQ